jgi:hypothetical protein
MMSTHIRPNQISQEDEDAQAWRPAMSASNNADLAVLFITRGNVLGYY